MPYKSEKQRKFMYSQHPGIAKKWDKEGKNYIESEKSESPSHDKNEKVKEAIISRMKKK